MSDTGLNANIYYLTSKYLELINDFLVAIQEDTEEPTKEQINEIKSLIKNLQNEDIVDTKIQTLSVIIESELRENKIKPKKFYNSLSDNLSKEKYANLADNLDRIITALDDEYSHALAKMKAL